MNEPLSIDASAIDVLLLQAHHALQRAAIRRAVEPSTRAVVLGLAIAIARAGDNEAAAADFLGAVVPLIARDAADQAVLDRWSTTDGARDLVKTIFAVEAVERTSPRTAPHEPSPERDDAPPMTGTAPREEAAADEAPRGRTWAEVFRSLVQRFREWWSPERRSARLMRKAVSELADQVYLRLPAVPAMRYSPGARSAALAASRRIPVPSTRLAVQPTLHESIRHGGLLRPMFRRRSVAPEYVVLAKQLSDRDLEYERLRATVEELQQLGVFIDQYAYRHDPREIIDTLDQSAPRLIDLDELGQRHPNARLLVATDGRELLHPVTHRAPMWALLFRQWSHRALLSSLPSDDWGDVERALHEQLGFTIASSHEQAMRALDEVFRTTTPRVLAHPRQTDAPVTPMFVVDGSLQLTLDLPPSDEERAGLLSELEDHLRPAGMEWLGACAHFPAMAPAIALAIGRQLFGVQQVAFHRAFTKLAGLPWMRRGHMPHWARAMVVSALSPAQRQRARAAARAILDEQHFVKDPPKGTNRVVSLQPTSEAAILPIRIGGSGESGGVEVDDLTLDLFAQDPTGLDPLLSLTREQLNAILEHVPDAEPEAGSPLLQEPDAPGIREPELDVEALPKVFLSYSMDDAATDTWARFLVSALRERLGPAIVLTSPEGRSLSIPERAERMEGISAVIAIGTPGWSAPTSSDDWTSSEWTAFPNRLIVHPEGEPPPIVNEIEGRFQTLAHGRRTNTLDPDLGSIVAWLEALDPHGIPDAGTVPEPETSLDAPEAVTANRSVAQRLLETGRARLEAGEFDLAIELLREATEADPTYSRAARALGNAHAEAKEWETAIKVLEGAAELEDTPVFGATIATDIAEAYRKSERYEEAIEHYDRALRIKEDFMWALGGRGECLRMLGSVEASIEWFDRALGEAPEHVFALQGKAAALNTLGRFEEALPVWEKALALEDSEFATEGRAFAVRELEHDQTADPTHRTAHQKARDELHRGRRHAKNGDYASAIEAFRAALELDPEFAEASLRLGLAYEGNKQLDEAIAAYEQCLVIDPEHFHAATNIGEAYRKNERYEEAIPAYDRALTIKDDYLYALAGRAESMRFIGELVPALAWFDRALEVSPRHVFAIQGKAATLNTLERFDEALPLWEKALRIEPDSPFAREGLALTRSRLAPPHERSHPLPTSSGPPDRPKAREVMEQGRVAYRDKNYEAAADYFEDAMVYDPTFAEASLRLGMAYEELNRLDDAVEAYEVCLRIDPDHFHAATNIGEAYRKNERYEESILAYERALGIKDDYLYAIAGRAESMRMLGDLPGALVWFDRALEVGSRHAFAIQGKAAALNTLQRYRESVPLWHKALEIEPDSQFARDGLAFAQQHLGEGRTAPPRSRLSAARMLQTAGEHADAAISAGSKLEAFLMQLAMAWSLPLEPERSRSIAQLNQVLRAHPNYPSSTFDDVQNWAALRNTAVHDRDAFDPETLEPMLDGIEAFMAEFEAVTEVGDDP